METPQGFYVYELVDPRDGQAFYVGKGKGARAWNHEMEVRKGGGINAAKCERIRSILNNGDTVKVSIVQAEMSEDDAYSLEGRLIAERRTTLTNVADGGIRRAVTAKELPYLMQSRPEVPLVRTMLRLLGEAELLRKGRESEPFSETEAALGKIFRKCWEAVETIIGEPFVSDGCEMEWAV